VAAGALRREPVAEDARWVRLPEGLTPQPGHFIVRVTGESMNRRIPSGSWCLFRRPPEGSREGRIVLVQHRDLQDPEGGACTVKRYESAKDGDGEGSWRHTRIILRPQSNDPSFSPIELTADPTADFRVLGEFLAVL
jgi:SOS-response transcriptional repressor LexA